MLQHVSIIYLLNAMPTIESDTRPGALSDISQIFIFYYSIKTFFISVKPIIVSLLLWLIIAFLLMLVFVLV